MIHVMLSPDEATEPDAQFCGDSAIDESRMLHHRRVRQLDLLSPLPQFVCEDCGLHTQHRIPS